MLPVPVESVSCWSGSGSSSAEVTVNYDVIVRGGTLIDPSHGIHGRKDIGIRDGRIAAVEPDLASSAADLLIEADGRLVTPGLIDIHTHVARGIMPIALDPDEAGINSGVTAISDAGSLGVENYGVFKESILPGARTDVFCFLHLCPTGQAVSPEAAWDRVDLDRTQGLISDESEIIRGVKIRANGPAVIEPKLELMNAAKSVSRAANVPLMVHIGLNSEEAVSDDAISAFNRDVVALLGPGDVLTHVYSARRGRLLLEDRGLMADLLEAVGRGVVMDAAPAKSHFSFEHARRAISEGLAPTTISTDITKTNYQGPALFSLPVVMSKFLALGLTLDDVIEKTTAAPARVLGEEHRRGSLGLGSIADLTAFELLEGRFVFADGIAGNTLEGDRLLEPRMTIKAGEQFEARSRFRDHVPGEEITLTKGA